MARIARRTAAVAQLTPEDLARAGYDSWLVCELAEAGLDPPGDARNHGEHLVMDRAIVSTGLSRLRDLGVHIAVDDFGTGYANLAYLTSSPLDTLKIDRGLIADMVGGTPATESWSRP